MESDVISYPIEEGIDLLLFEQTIEIRYKAGPKEIVYFKRRRGCFIDVYKDPKDPKATTTTYPIDKVELVIVTKLPWMTSEDIKEVLRDY